MTRRKVMSFMLRILMVLVLTLIMSVSVSGSVYADKKTDLEKEIAEKQKAIDEAEKERKAINEDLTDVEKLKKNLEKSKNDLASYVVELDEQVVQIQANIDALLVQISEKEKELEQTRSELDEAIATKDEHYAAMKARIQTMYEQGDMYYVEILASAGSFGDFLNEVDYIGQISEYDNKKMEEYKEIVAYVTVCKEQLEAEEAVLTATKEAAESEQAALETLIEEKQREIETYEKDIATKEALIREYEADLAEQNAIIEELERAVEQARKDLWNQRVYDGGAFCWPAPEYTRISDDYGYRINPVTGKKQFHTGVDMASPGGSPILAAYDGEVIAAAYNASMGNYIMIDHGDGLYTIYMHAQKLLVSSGEEVKRGQKIATVGTTGRSTGNHLHFGVRQDGVYVSPWNYLSKP